MIHDPQESPDLSVGISWKLPFVVDWTQLLLDSYHHWFNHELIARRGNFQEQSHQLFDTPFVVVSHDLQQDPILNYGNRAALVLWETTWDQLTRTPSRLTAEPLNRAERAQMLQRASQHGFIDDYRGIRISMTGKRFLVEGAIVWNVVDSHGRQLGQAATFSQWKVLDSIPPPG
jgi:hypothetical protein